MAEVRLAELVAALSLGVDLGFGQPMEHVLRECMIALRLADRIGLGGGGALERLLHGAARQRRLPLRRARAGEVVRGRHRAQVRQVRRRHAEPARAAAAMLSLVGSGNPPLHRFRVGLEFAISGRHDLDGMIARHAALATRAWPSGSACRRRCRRRSAPRTSSGTARAGPASLAGDAIPVAARLAQFAEFVEVAHRLGGVDAALALAERARRARSSIPRCRQPAARRSGRRFSASSTPRTPGVP